MKKLLTIALAAALCAPAFAQKMGSTNSNAPQIKQTMTMGDTKLSLDYTSITLADGKTMALIMDKEKGAGFRKSLNDRASKAPLATFASSVAVTVGTTNLPAGDYKVFFTVGDDLEWSMNFMGKDDKVHTVKLDLMPSHEESKRLLLCLYAEEEGAGVYMMFGDKSGMLKVKPQGQNGGENGDK